VAAQVVASRVLLSSTELVILVIYLENVRLSLLGTSAATWTIVPVLDDDYDYNDARGDSMG
jgi:hypothetical protein